MVRTERGMEKAVSSSGPSLLIGVRNNQIGIHREALAADQASPDARAHSTLKQAAKDAAFTEPLIASPRKRRVIRDLVFNRGATKPPIGKVHSHNTAQRPAPSESGITSLGYGKFADIPRARAQEWAAYIPPEEPPLAGRD